MLTDDSINLNPTWDGWTTYLTKAASATRRYRMFKSTSLQVVKMGRFGPHSQQKRRVASERLNQRHSRFEQRNQIRIEYHMLQTSRGRKEHVIGRLLDTFHSQDGVFTLTQSLKIQELPRDCTCINSSLTMYGVSPNSSSISPCSSSPPFPVCRVGPR